MVEKIKDLKDELLMQAEQDMHDGGVDPMTIDNIKDLAEAEKSCWEAEYYRAVTEAMEDGKMGYDDSMAQYGGRNQQGGRGYRRGYRGQSRDSMGRYTSRRGYRQSRYGHQDVIGDVRQAMMAAEPQEREQLKTQLRKLMEM